MTWRWRRRKGHTMTCILCGRELSERDWIRPWRACRYPCHLAIISGIPWFRVSAMRADSFLQRENVRREVQISPGSIRIESDREFTEEERAAMQAWRDYHMKLHGLAEWSLLTGGGSFRIIEAPFIAWYTTADLTDPERLDAWTRAEAELECHGDWGNWAGLLIDEWEARHDELSYWALVQKVAVPGHFPPAPAGAGISLSAVTQ